MPTTSIIDCLRPILSDQFGVEEFRITPEASFIDDLGADSLDRVEIAFTAEDVFGVDLSDDELETVVTVGDLVAIVERKQSK